MNNQLKRFSEKHVSREPCVKHVTSVDLALDLPNCQTLCVQEEKSISNETILKTLKHEVRAVRSDI